MKAHFFTLKTARVVFGTLAASAVAAVFLQAPSAHAAVRTWDGGGADTNWDTCANWSADTCPTGSDVATFDATSSKNAVINNPVTVLGVDIGAGYAGIISQAVGRSLTVQGSGYVQAGGTFTAADAPITINGSLTVSGGTFTSPTNATLTVLNNFTMGTGSTVNFGSTVDLNSNFIQNGGTLNMGSSTVTIAGNVQADGGTMNQGTSSVTMDSGSQLITGNPMFYNFTKTGTGNMILSANNTMTVTGTLTLQGTSSSSQVNIYTNSAGTRATLVASGTIATLQNLYVRDISASQAMSCLSGCTDAGNNVNWTFTRRSGSEYIGEAARTVTLTGPNGGEALVAGENEAITWNWTGSVSMVDVLFSADGGETWETLVRATNNDGSYTWTVPATATTEGMIRIDATDLVVAYATDSSNDVFTISTTDADEEVSEEDTELPASMNVHDLVKLADDGNPDTQVDSAVYYIGADGMRHAFPNEKVFFTWFTNFDDVHVVSASDLASVSLGRNITYRPGARMVKFQTSPKVYAVDRYGTLRWVGTEAIATALYGSTWNTKIDDISDAFFGNYTFGTSITSTSSFDVDEVYDGVEFPSDSLAQ